eukprot:15361275-Ditylum_brightwellii.AAC.1
MIGKQQHNSSKHHQQQHVVFDAWIADAMLKDGIVGGPNLQLRGAMQLLDQLFCRFLQIEHDGMKRYYQQQREQRHQQHLQQIPPPPKYTLILRCGVEDGIYTCASYRAAILRGFCPIPPQTSCYEEESCYYDFDEGL